MKGRKIIAGLLGLSLLGVQVVLTGCSNYSPKEGAIVEMQTQEQRLFIEKVQQQGIDEAINWLRDVQGSQEFSYPAQVQLSWEGDAGSYILEISETEDFLYAQKIICPKNTYGVENLKIGCTYYWRVNEGKIHSFKTVEEAIDFLMEMVEDGDAVLVKASRGMHFEQVTNVLKTEFGDDEIVTAN